MTFHLRTHSFEFRHPAPSEPAWSASVERWYQLDAYAYGFAEAYSHLCDSLSPSPDLLILASAEASNRTDSAFVTAGASSPSKFVHTLPNIRSAPLLQVMKWTGPVLCLQKDPGTLIAGLDEGLLHLEALEELQRVWCLSVERASENRFMAWFHVLTRESVVSELEIHIGAFTKRRPTDSEWLTWLKSGTKEFTLSERYRVARK